MAKTAQFYILTEDCTLTVEEIVCNLACLNIGCSGKKVLISCESETQALEIDERLWQRDPNEFVPHNLSGEATQYPTPIEISWLGKRNLQRRDVLIKFATRSARF